MENHHTRFPIIVLRIEITPEESCEFLKELLLRINGVHQVAINREKEKATIIGDVDPLKLVKYIAKMGKKTELVKYKKPKAERSTHHKTGHESRDKHPNIGGNQNARQPGTVGCPDDHHPHNCKVNKDSFHRPAAAKDVDEEEIFRERQYDQFHDSFQRGDHNYRASKKKVEKGTSRDPYAQFHSVHNDNKYHSAATGRVEEEMCHDHQYAQFHGSSRNAKGFVPPMNNEGAKCHSCPHNHPHYNTEDSTHQEEMKQGRPDQFYGRSRSTNGFVPPRNNGDHDAKHCSFPDDQEERGSGGYERQFHGRTRNYANYEYSRPGYDEEDTCGKNKDYPHMKGYTFREAKIEEVIKEAKKDMDRFFKGINGIRSNYDDHFPVGSTSAYHHDVPRADEHYQNRDHPPPAFRERPKPPDFDPPDFEQHRERMPSPPPRVYRGGRSAGIHYDQFTNFFSDENPSSCTIV